ncbi:MAG TPA: hypothetical protein VLQ80_08605 [Candidatus Saccharimonadia bacterium]|nr:hypothetical protein [Candidatus Saccharimonadia bacterium]
MTLLRLPRHQAAEMTDRVAHSKTLPAEVIKQVVAKTDGVPLFVEELTKMVLESGLLQEREERYELIGPLPPLAIPATLSGHPGQGIRGRRTGHRGAKRGGRGAGDHQPERGALVRSGAIPA